MSKRREKDGIDIELLNNVIEMLAKGETLPEKYKNHQLRGNLKGVYDYI